MLVLEAKTAMASFKAIQIEGDLALDHLSWIHIKHPLQLLLAYPELLMRVRFDACYVDHAASAQGLMRSSTGRISSSVNCCS